MIHKLIPVMLFSLFTGILSAKPLELGASAPQVTAIDHQGATIDLGAALNQGTSVVFFYPKAFTPGCTKQACSLRNAWDELQTRDVKIFGVSVDSAATQQRFRDKHALPFTLIADSNKEVSKAFGKYRFSRHAYIFQSGKLVWRDLSAATSDQAADVLAALDALRP
ncbi:MAG TPA: peroxiredoxin [Opitutae bacterium]|nr:peroxiredoxin [Opitutae bacterium]